jgi:hypothetical protein
MTDIQFDNRVDAGQRLGTLLKRIRMQHPLVLAIPRGGIEVAAPLAEALGAEMDVLLCDLFGRSADLINEWSRTHRYVTGRELVAAGLAELIDLAPLPSLFEQPKS